MKTIAKVAEKLLNQTQPIGESPKNSAPVSAHGRKAFTKSYERDGDNRTADGAPAEAGVSPNGFKNGRR
jgi:hypothetical protein